MLAAGEALLAAGDKAAATALLSDAAKKLGNEPTRTALHLMVALAKASQDPQAARTAISLYQALPKLARPDIDAMWTLGKQYSLLGRQRQRQMRTAMSRPAPGTANARVAP